MKSNFLNVRKSLAGLVLVALGVACASPSTSQTKEVADIPKATWEPIYFEAIRERAALSGLSDLRAMSLPASDLEVRIWEGLGITYLQGVVLRKKDGKWSIHRLLSALKDRPDLNRRRFMVEARQPMSGFEDVWQEMVSAGILTIRDSSEFQDKVILDGFSYVVEIRKHKYYRTYMVNNPDIRTTAEDRKMLNVLQILYERAPDLKASRWMRNPLSDD